VEVVGGLSIYLIIIIFLLTILFSNYFGNSALVGAWWKVEGRNGGVCTRNGKRRGWRLCDKDNHIETAQKVLSKPETSATCEGWSGKTEKTAFPQ